MPSYLSMEPMFTFRNFITSLGDFIESPVASSPRALVRSTIALSAVAALGLPQGSQAAEVSEHPAQEANLLTNGSFELGLGAEPFYPGWAVPKAGLADCEVPALPELDSEQAHSGTQSLKLARSKGVKLVYLDIHSPDFTTAGQTWFSFWAKASRPGVDLIAGVCPADGKGRSPNAPQIVRGKLSGEWQEWKGTLTVDKPVVPLRIEFASREGSPFEVWIDDIAWTTTPPADTASQPRASEVEVVLLPASRNGIHVAGQPVNLRWSAQAAKPCQATLSLRLRDLARQLPEETLWESPVELGTEARQGDIPLGVLKRGAYFAVVEVRDAASGALLGTGRERFTVMTDLHEVPAPVDFNVGYHGGLEWPRDGDVSFNWRGHWDIDEFFSNNFQTGFRVQRDIWDWEKVEPLPGDYRWGELDVRTAAAARNGCTTIICIPHKPLNMKREEYAKLMAGTEEGNGMWLYRTSKDISEYSVRSNPMGSSSDPQQRNILLAPDPEVLSDFMAELAERYADKIEAIEYLNEPNLYINPEGLIEFYFKPAYDMMKLVAPDLLVFMNQTADFSADGNGYTGQFLRLGGAEYCDGVSYHPYGSSLLESGGLAAAKNLESLLKQYSTPEKELLLGMSEIHGLGGSSNMTFVRTAALQRALLDWAIGARWSAGIVLSRNNFYEGVGPRNWFLRGPFVPGIGATYMNGMFAALGGYELRERIELDENVLIISFDRQADDSADKPYAVAIMAAKMPLRRAELESSLDGVAFEAFDSFAEPMALEAPGKIQLGTDALYLKSDDPALFEVLKKARVTWAQDITGETEILSGPEAEQFIYRTGLPPMEAQTCGVIQRWTLLDVGDKAVTETSPVEAGLANAEGELIWPVDKTHSVDQPLPYVVLDDGRSGQGGHVYACTSIYSPKAQELALSWSATVPSTLWLNGVEKVSLPVESYEPVGARRTPVTLKLREGMNHIYVALERGGAPAVFALSADAVPTDVPAKADADGYIRSWYMIGPWANWRNTLGVFVGNTRKYPPEQHLTEPDLKMVETGKDDLPLAWFQVEAKTPSVPHPWNDAVSYAFAAVEVDSDTDCVASLGSDDGYTLWVNGELIGRNAASRSLTPDEEKLPLTLKKGRNTVLFKIDDTAAGGGFALRFVDADGQPVELNVVEP